MVGLFRWVRPIRTFISKPCRSGLLCCRYSSLAVIDYIHLPFSRPENVFLFQCASRVGEADPLHALLIVSGRTRDIMASVNLCSLYADINDIPSSRRVFDQMLEKNLLCWSTMISGYVKNRCYREAVDCYYQLLTTTGLHPDSFTFVVVLKFCDLEEGTKVHCWVLKLGHENDVSVAGSLIRMYTKFGSIDNAYQVFSQMPVRDVTSWSAMIYGLCRNGKAVEALGVLQEMMLEGLRMDDGIISSVLSVCAPVKYLWMGRLLHVYSLKCGLVCDVCVSNALISMYEKMDCISDAHQIFDDMEERDLVTWNAMVTAYKKVNDPVSGMFLFKGMQEAGLQSDVTILVNLASMAAQLGDGEIARSVHGFILRREWIFKDKSAGSSLVDMYGKLGEVDYAKKVFDGMPTKNVVTWSALISGFSQKGLADEAIQLYCRMVECPEAVFDEVTLVSVLPAISQMGALREGVTIHARSIRLGMGSNTFLASCLVDMYGKCGRLDDAKQLFDEVAHRSTVLWTVIISVHGIDGKCEKAIELFKQMQEEGVPPSHVTYVCLLSACGRSGLVDEGQKFFDMMKSVHGMEPDENHYSCMVDLFSRAGLFDTAIEFIRTMQLTPNAKIWSSLLGGWRVHRNINLSASPSNDLFELTKE